MAPKDVHILIPITCEYELGKVNVKGGFADKVKLRVL